MHFKEFDIKKEGKVFQIERIMYPRMSLIIDCTLPMPQIRDIKLLDECSADEFKSILFSLEELIKTLKD